MRRFGLHPARRFYDIYGGPFGRKLGNPDLTFKELYDRGIVIDEPNVVYYIPDYLIAKHNKHLKKEKEKREKQKKAKEKAAQDKIYVKDNYNQILENAKEKKEIFDETKTELLSKIKKLENKSKKFEERYDQILIDINDVIDFDIVNIARILSNPIAIPL